MARRWGWLPANGSITRWNGPQGTGLVLLTDGLFEGHSGGATNASARKDYSSWRDRWRRLPGPEFVDALIDEAAQRAQAYGGLTDDIAVVRVERIDTG